MADAPPALLFTEAECEAAWKAWGFNCGPAALCGVLRLRPEQVQPHLPDFPRRRYTTPMMMFQALRSLLVPFKVVGNPNGITQPWPKLGFVRVQWGGRWMRPGVPMVARYRYTHWVGSWVSACGTPAIFDVNAVQSGGWLNVHTWEQDVVPHLTEFYKGSDGTWLMTHVITVQQ